MGKNWAMQLDQSQGRNLMTTENTPAIQQTDEERSFALAMRQAKALSVSELVPQMYQGDSPKAQANCLIAHNMAQRIGADTLQVMQNLDIIHGKPSFSSKFIIGAINASGRFSPLRFKFQGTEGQDDWGCRATAKDLEDGELLQGPLVTMGMAKAEGWSTKSGSKWKTIPELMLHYRSATFFGRLYAPEIMCGLRTVDESQDIGAARPVKDDRPTGKQLLESVGGEPEDDTQEGEFEDMSEGEVEEI